MLYLPPLSPVAGVHAPFVDIAAVQYQTTLPSSFALERLGIFVESESATIRNTGEIIATSLGEFIERTVQVSTPSQTYEVTVTELDVGAGSQQLQLVAGEDGIVQGSTAAAQVESEPLVDLSFGNSGAVIETNPLTLASAPTAEVLSAEGFLDPATFTTTTDLAAFDEFVTSGSTEVVYDSAELTPDEIAALEAQFGFLPGGFSGGEFFL